LPETARNPGYSATVRFQRPKLILASQHRGGRGRAREGRSQFLLLYAGKEGKMEYRLRMCRSRERARIRDRRRRNDFHKSPS